MKDRIKILITLVLVLALLAIAWFVFLSPEQPEPAPRPVTAVVEPEPEPEPEPEQEEEQEVDNRQELIARLLPLVQQENRHILEQREHLQNVGAGLLALDSLSEADFNWLKSTASRYQLDPARRSNATFFARLESRIDIVPVSIVIALAALESDWGQAGSGNNIFHLKCYTKGCGTPPPEPPIAGYYELRRFASLKDAVSAQMLELNTNDGYKSFRDIRQAMRQDGQTVQGALLSDGLAEYHDLGSYYSKAAREIIVENKLDEMASY